MMQRRGEALGKPAAKQLRARKPLEQLSPCAGVMGWKGKVVVLLELLPASAPEAFFATELAAALILIWVVVGLYSKQIE